MARKGFLRRSWEAVKNAPRRTAEAVAQTTKTTVTAVKNAPRKTVDLVKKPFKRKPKPAPKKVAPPTPPKPAIPPHPRTAPTFGVPVETRVQRYKNLSKPRRSELHPKDEERQFWALYDQMGE